MSMPEKKTIERARADRRAGKAATTQAGEFVREEIHHVREGKHGARSAKQAIAIGLSKARRAGVELPRPRQGSSKGRKRSSTKRKAGSRRGAARARPSRTRSKATRSALKREGRRAASRTALARQASHAARKRPASERSRAARRAARTKTPAQRSAAAKKAARSRSGS
jgi:hypothetical protein